MRDTRCEREKIQSQRHLHHSLIMMMIQRFALLARFGSSSLFLRQRNRNRTRAKWCIFFSNVWHKIVRYFDRNDPLRLFVNSSSKVGWLSWQTSHCTFEECISCESIWRCFSGWLADSVMFHAYYPIANYLRTTMRIGKVVKSDRHLRVRAPNNLGHMSCGSGTDVILYSSCTRLVLVLYSSCHLMSNFSLGSPFEISWNENESVRCRSYVLRCRFKTGFLSSSSEKERKVKASFVVCIPSSPPFDPPSVSLALLSWWIKKVSWIFSRTSEEKWDQESQWEWQSQTYTLFEDKHLFQD